MHFCFVFFFQAEDGIRDKLVTGVQTCALPISGEGGEHHLWSFHLQPTRHPVRDERGVLLHPCAAEPVTSDVLTPRDGTGISYSSRSSSRRKGAWAYDTSPLVCRVRAGSRGHRLPARRSNRVRGRNGHR